MDRIKNLLGIVLLVSLAALGAAFAADPEKPLDNAEIIKLTKLDMGDSVIVAKIKAASSVHFATTSDDLVKLKEAGVSKAVMAAMVEKSAPAAPPAAAAASAGHGGGGGGYSVTLKASDATTQLNPIDGDVKTIVAPFVGMRRFIVFSDLQANTRTKDHRPSVVLASDKDPRKTFWYVKLDQDKDKDDMDRSIDVESPGMWGGVMSSAPDDDMQVKCDIKEDGPGMWRFTPLKDLKPGEYGLYVGKGEMSAILYDFGVDK